MYLVDTNVLSELRRGAKADANVKAWGSAASLDSAWISAITILEIEIGILRIERRDPVQAAILRKWFETWLLVKFRDRTLVVDTAVARTGAALHVPNPKPERDALIGATAVVHRLTIVTRNTADFTPMGVGVFNPWLAP